MAECRRILVADDDPRVQRAVRRYAELRSYEVIEALNGKDVKKVAMEQRPDLVVLDINFPDADGRDILAQLKADERTADIPVLVWSARDPESDRGVAIGLGAEDYVEKESAQTLMTKIERVLLRLGMH